MNINHLLSRTWKEDYTCNEFACEAWLDITGEDLTSRLKKFLNGEGEFKSLDEPISPCIVFFYKRTQKLDTCRAFLLRKTFASLTSRCAIHSA